MILILTIFIVLDVLLNQMAEALIETSARLIVDDSGVCESPELVVRINVSLDGRVGGIGFLYSVLVFTVFVLISILRGALKRVTGRHVLRENSGGAKILAELGSKVKILIISLFLYGPSLSFSEYPYLIQIGEDDFSQARAIVTLAEQHRWRNITLIYEDNDSAREIHPKLIMSLEGSDVLLAKHIAVLPSYSDEEIIDQMKMQDEHYEMNSTSYSCSKLEVVTWPGGTLNIPKGWSLQGKKLRIGVPVRNGFRELINVNVDPQTNETTVTGFCADVFKAAIETLDYQVNYEFIPIIDMAGLYNDLFYQIYLKNYDAVVGDTTIISSRFSYVDFTLPYTDMGIGLIVPKTTSKNNIWIFLKPLAGDLWITTAAFFIFTGFVVWLIERPMNDDFQDSPLKQIGTIFWFSFSTLVFAHREKLLNNLSKFVVTIWVFVVLILTSSYTATLASMLTIQRIQLNSREDYIGYHSAFLPSATSNLNDGNPRLKPLPYQSAEDIASALTKGSKKGGVSAIIGEIPYIKLVLAKYSTSSTMIKSESILSGFGFAFAKGSPLVQDMSSAISKLREEGKLQTMENLWFNTHSTLTTSEDSTTSTNPSSLNLHSFIG
ncbi:Ionotropic glutamate receptor [Corchorus capsularis]|uniref:Ionotropic glutamate receptor n=1 Tax=Corchorus capsularis TaxID=210143 RepID=A0A1R3H4Q8_COCAP|nr:Ionotropic glutamate receptor [Corchorus capsularis]